MSANSLALLIPWLFSLAAFASLCLATPRHSHRLKFAQHHRHWRIPLRAVGATLLVAALHTAISTNGWGVGLVDLFGALTLSAFIVIAAATYRPEWLGVIGVMGFLIGASGLIVLDLW